MCGPPNDEDYNYFHSECLQRIKELEAEIVSLKAKQEQMKNCQNCDRLEFDALGFEECKSEICQGFFNDYEKIDWTLKEEQK